MSEKIRRFLRRIGDRGIILFLMLMLTAGITVVALLSGRTIRMEQQASDLSKAVLLAASAADIWYETGDSPALSEIMTGDWDFREISSAEGQAEAGVDILFENPEGFRVGFRFSEENGFRKAELTVFRNGGAVYRADLKKAGRRSDG